MTQKEMAIYCNVPISAYGAIERLDYEHSEATETNLKKIAEAIEIEFDKLFPKWAVLVGRTINDSYLLLDDEYAQKSLCEFGNSQKLLTESFETDLNDSMEKDLTKREIMVIKNYFGVLGYPQLTYEELAKAMCLTKERIRQIKDNALLKLQFSRNKDLLQSYIGDTFAG